MPRDALAPPFRGPMKEPTKLELKFPAPCAACGQSMRAGTPAYGIRREGDRTWTVWHANGPCNEQMREKQRNSPPVQASPVGPSSILEAYDNEG